MMRRKTEAISGADPLTGIPTMSRKDDRQYIPSVFVQDDWKVRPNLTVNLGLRWEYFARHDREERQQSAAESRYGRQHVH